MRDRPHNGPLTHSSRNCRSCDASGMPHVLKLNTLSLSSCPMALINGDNCRESVGQRLSWPKLSYGPGIPSFVLRFIMFLHF